jgi:hypothetical protein
MWIIELLFEWILYLLFNLPGAFIRWAAGGFKRTFMDVASNDLEINAFVGILVFVSIFLLLVIV